MKWLAGILLPMGIFASAAITGCGSISLTGGANQIQLGIYRSLCVDVKDASTASGASVEAYACGSGKRSQEWSFRTASSMSNQYTIMNTNSGMCMSVASDPDTAPGQLVVQVPCDSSQQDQIWTVSRAPSGQEGFRFISAASSQCLDLPYGATASVFDLQQYYCTANDPAQGWSVQPVSEGNTP